MDSKKPTIVLIGGNRGAGKNTFAAVLRKSEYEITNFQFALFSQRPFETMESSLLAADSYTELSFARVLKQYVADVLSILFEEIESLKDKPLAPDVLEKYSLEWFQQPESQSPTLRDVLIDVAARNLTSDPGFYARTLFEQTITSMIENNPSSVFLITDWRYKAEWEFYKNLETQGIIELRTCRIMNKDAPPVFVPSERNLDDFTPHYIVKPLSQLDSITTIFNKIKYYIFHYTDDFF